MSQAPTQIKYRGQIYKRAGDGKHATVKQAAKTPPKNVTAKQYTQAITRLLHVENPTSRTPDEVLAAFDKAMRELGVGFGDLKYVYEILVGVEKWLEEEED